MDIREIERVLRETLVDKRLTGSERRALDAILAEARPDSRELAVIRSLAFDIARGEAIDPDSKKLIDWLEDAMKALAPKEDPDKRIPRPRTYFSPGEECPRAVVDLLFEARRTVDICVFTITDDRISSAITRAHERGVRVRIVTDREKSEDLGSDIAQLRKTGVPVRVDRDASHMHHKFAVFDDEQVATGSYNWTRSAGERNQENLVVLADPNVVRRFLDAFERLWEDLS